MNIIYRDNLGFTIIILFKLYIITNYNKVLRLS